MSNSIRLAALAGTLLVAACAPSAPEATPLSGDWTIDGDSSRLSYVSVKAGEIAESNRFSGLSGSVSADGNAVIEIDLATVNTGIDIRDGRMRDVLLNVAENPVATVSAQVDPKAFEALAIGDSVTQEVEALVSLTGIENTVFTELEVTRVAEDRVTAVSTVPIILDARAFELGDGLEQLRQLANLPSISPAVPVTFSITFER